MEKITDEEFEAYKRKRKITAWIKAIALTVVIVSILFALIELVTHSFASVSQFFLANIDSDTRGKIVKSKKIGKSINPYYVIEYEYSVEGTLYRGTLVNYKWRAQEVYRILADYPVGKIVTVHYDAERPGYAILENDYLGLENFLPIIFMLFVIPLSLWLLYSDFYGW